MSGKDVGDLLNKVYPSDSGIEDLVTLLHGDTSTLPTTFLPSVMMLVPQAYLNRQNRQIDVCGNVDQDTVEYDQGYRFYTSEAELYYSDGKYTSQGDHPGDLVQVLDSVPLTSRAITPYLWIHPQHLIIQAWFRCLVPGKIDLTTGGHYVNRMGHVIELVGDSFVKDDIAVYKDTDNRIYTLQGSLLHQRRSMFDLVHEIRHWTLFREQDWTGAKVIKKTSDQQQMALFDPTADDRRELMAKFFTAMSEVNRLAHQLNIDLGFKMETN